jgi:type II secretion system protein N
MKRKIWENRKWLGYIIYGLFLTIGLLYYCFPADAFRSFLKAAAKKAGPEYSLSIEKIKPVFPPGIILLKAGLSTETKEGFSLFVADRLMIRPEIISFMRGKDDYRFQGSAYGGDLKGHIHFSKGGITGPSNAFISLKNIQIGEHKSVSALLGRDIDGIIAGTVKFAGKFNSLIDGTGEANLKLSHGQIKLLQRILSFDSINFDDLSVKMSLGNRRVSMTNVELKGPDFKCTLSGNIALKEELSMSSLELRGIIRLLSAEFNDAKDTPHSSRYKRNRPTKSSFPFVIRGTLGAPGLRLL